MTDTRTTQVYQIYIKALPERVWDAITDPELIAQYFFGARMESSNVDAGSRLRSWSPRVLIRATSSAPK